MGSGREFQYFRRSGVRDSSLALICRLEGCWRAHGGIEMEGERDSEMTCALSGMNSPSGVFRENAINTETVS